MHQQTIKQIVEDLGKALTGRFVGRVFQLSRYSVAIDFGLREGTYLFIKVEPKRPGLYLVKRRLRELEQQSLPPSPFVQAMRSSLASGSLLSIKKYKAERVVQFFFSVRDELGDVHSRSLVAQLTGKSANLFILDDQGRIAQALRYPKGEGQQLNDEYQPPPRQTQPLTEEEPVQQGDFPSLSAAVDAYYQRLAAKEDFQNRVATIRQQLLREISQQEKLKTNLANDLASHGNAEQHKRIAELLLANIANASRSGNKVTVTDYFTEGQPTIEIEVDENHSLPEEAERRFSRYTKSKRAAEEIALRLVAIDEKLDGLNSRLAEFEELVANSDEAGLLAFIGAPLATEARPARKKRTEKIPGVRRYRSSDGYEILVGRAARDNDHLTFRIAAAADLWLHAADYPGSHVIVRSPGKKEIPQRTVIEAAQLAAKFSQASGDSKVTIHYTQRKFLSKPKKSAPGLVRMSSFRSLTVEPKEAAERIY